MAYKYIAETWQNRKTSTKQHFKDRLIVWRKDKTVSRIERPTRLDKARRLGYKAKKGYVLARVKIRRGGMRKKRPRSGRRQKRMGVTKFKLAKSLRLISEERAARKFPNLEILNSYPVGQDGLHKWFEIIMINRTLLPHLRIRKDRGKAFKGLTSAGKRVRGLYS